MSFSPHVRRGKEWRFSCASFLPLLVLTLLSVRSEGLGFRIPRVKRVKAGTEYEKHDPVHIMVNKIGPFYNPAEMYHFYSLPFCETHSKYVDVMYFIDALKQSDVDPEKVNALTEMDTPVHKGDLVGGLHHYQGLGEKLTGHRLQTSPYEVTFMDDVKWRPLCEKNLIASEVKQFKDAIHNDWFFEMFVEDLPMWGYLGDTLKEDLLLGEMQDSITYLYPHLHFKFGVNGDQIVEAQVSTDKTIKVELKENENKPTNVHFSYSVEWFKSSISWKDRMSLYDDSKFSSSTVEVHWLSIINSVVLVLLLTAFLILILVRILKNDFVRDFEVDEADIGEDETGWKLIHGDVFRFPTNIILFSSAVGTGVQLMVTTAAVFGLALTGFVSTTRRGSILAASVIAYCIFSIVGGYSAGRLYIQMGGKSWSRSILTTAFLFPGPLFFIFCFANTVALVHRSTSALPFSAVFTVLALYSVLSFPLTVIGGILAKNYASPKFEAPTRTTKVAREIPTEVPWYKGRSMQLIVSSLLPFSAIYIELNYIFASMWGHQIYTLFGILFLALLLLIVVTSFMSVTMLYFQLAREDHRWWWATFINGGATGIVIYLYSFVYYFYRSEMNGWLQGSFFFGYMAAVSYAFFLILGTSAFYAGLFFVRFIYARVKCD